MTFEGMTLTLSLLQQMCVYLVIAYLLSKTPLFIPLTQVTIGVPRKLLCYVMFSMFCVMGTLLGLNVGDAVANTRAIGAVLSGILGGPVVGLAVGLTGGLHRYTMGGSSAVACAISTTVEGLVGGLVHLWLVRRKRSDQLFRPLLVSAVALVCEILQMAILLLVMRPFALAEALVLTIALPMLTANTLGAGLFMLMLRDRRETAERFPAAFSAKALKIAARAEGALRAGLDQDNSARVARIIHEETGVGAVEITDRQRILAFIGTGADHHRPGDPVASPHTLNAIAQNQVVYADGNETPYRCPIESRCRLGSSLVIPLRGEGALVVGTINLYEPKTRLFSNINRALGEGIGRLLSTQILAGNYERQKQLLAQSEIKLLQAQINPHFLFNALNTLSAVIRHDPDHARKLVQHLSTFFRKNLKRTSDEVRLSEEIEHVNSYLQIELARFAGKLNVDYDVPNALMSARLPAFSLQPIVENAIKHGTSHSLEPGEIRIGARQSGSSLALWVEDNAGLFQDEPRREQGIGMSLVDRRVRARYGEAYGVQVQCEPGRFTRVSLNLPLDLDAA
jgi:two-component system LytT family sensor kinase